MELLIISYKSIVELHEQRVNFQQFLFQLQYFFQLIGHIADEHPTLNFYNIMIPFSEFQNYTQHLKSHILDIPLKQTLIILAPVLCGFYCKTNSFIRQLCNFFFIHRYKN